MKVSLNWLKDFVEIKKSPEVLAQLLTMAGLEVKGIEKKLNDYVFEIEITSNRPDWLSMIGVAREIGAIAGKKIQVSKCQSVKVSKKVARGSLISIKIEDKKACPLYTACLIKNVKVGPSPKWLRERFEVLGVRPINNVVDITNYILLETGQPLHAFDWDKLSLPIIVRRAKDQEEIVLIDGTVKKLDKETLVIANSEKAIALAGIMGGQDSQVNESTQNILLESAYFNPIVIRNASKKSALSTDSSYRFERTVDVQMVEDASLRAQRLICELCTGEFVAIKRVGKKISKTKRTISFNPDIVNKILGIEIPIAKIKLILNNLGLGVSVRANKLLLTMPSFRQDLKTKEDIVEEIARIFGYDNIPLTAPAIIPGADRKSSYDFTNLIKDTLVGLGLSEVKTYSLISKELLKKSGQEAFLTQAKELENPLSLEFQFLRPSLVASLLNCVSYNINHKNHNLRLFEISNTFLDKETPSLGIIICGSELICSNNEKIIIENNFYYLKGLIGNLLEKLKIKDINFLGQKIICDNKAIGVFGRAEKRVLDSFDIKTKDGIWFAEIYLEDLASISNQSTKYQPYCAFPAISRDISISIKEEIKFAELEGLIRNNAGKDLASVKLIDVYRGKNIPEKHKNFTFSLTWQSNERTLEEKEIEQIHKNICTKLISDLGAQIR